MEAVLLCVGDVVGGPGRRLVTDRLAGFSAANQVDCSIVNVENAAAGSGLTAPLYEKFVQAGVNLMTLGDHVYRRKDVIGVLERSDCIVRPANLAPDAPGRSFALYESAGGVRVAVVSVLGRMFMRIPVDCPYRAVDRVLDQIPGDVRIVVVDMHAEATAEKVAMGWHLDGRVSVVFGTHTHVPTADEQVLPGGTAYVTDLGMTGPYDSVLGRRKDRVLSSMLHSVPTVFDVAEGDVRMCGVMVRVQVETGRALGIERVCVRADDGPER